MPSYSEHPREILTPDTSKPHFTKDEVTDAAAAIAETLFGGYNHRPNGVGMAAARNALRAIFPEATFDE